MEYKILSDRIASELEKDIKKALEDGWQLYGNLIYGEKEVQSGSYSTTTVAIPMFYQAVIRPTTTSFQLRWYTDLTKLK